jgi:hypothetical protein
MSREATYLENVRRLRLPMLRSYLESRGGTRVADYKGNLAIFTQQSGSLRQLLVPIHPEFDDFTDHMAQALQKLAEIEGRSERAVLHDLYASQMDTLRYRLESPAASRGTLLLEQGISARRCQEVVAGGGLHGAIAGSNVSSANEFFGRGGVCRYL